MRSGVKIGRVRLFGVCDCGLIPFEDYTVYCFAWWGRGEVVEIYSNVRYNEIHCVCMRLLLFADDGDAAKEVPASLPRCGFHAKGFHAYKLLVQIHILYHVHRND